jgi:hypothetical protein
MGESLGSVPKKALGVGTSLGSEEGDIPLRFAAPKAGGMTCDKLSR